MKLETAVRATNGFVRKWDRRTVQENLGRSRWLAAAPQIVSETTERQERDQACATHSY